MSNSKGTENQSSDGSLGARQIESYARNTDCERLGALLAGGYSPDEAVESFGEPYVTDTSPFPFARGNKYEAYLLRDSAKKLVEAFQKEERLSGKSPASRTAFIPSKEIALSKRRAHTIRRLRQMVSEGTPALLLKPRVLIQVADDVSSLLEPDFIAVTKEGRLRIGEIKAYPYQAGKTQSVHIETASRQCAVGAVALGQELRRYDIDGARVSASCDVVFSRPGSFQPVLRSLRMREDVRSVRRALEALENLHQRLFGQLGRSPKSAGPGSTDAEETDFDEPSADEINDVLDPKELRSIPARYEEHCHQHCPLQEVCREEAAQQGETAFLGDTTEEALADAGSLQRALDLGAKNVAARNAAERQLAERLGTLWSRAESAASTMP